MKFDLSQIKLSYNDVKRNLKLPDGPSCELAEFIGIMTGDGHISFTKKRYQVRITGNSLLEYQYLTSHVNRLIFRLFNINSKIRKRKNKNANVVYFSSKGFVSFMNKIGYYKHISNIKIPPWIGNDTNHITSFLRGLIDTGGCVFISDKKGTSNYPCIELTTVCFNLAKLTKDFLVKLRFKVPKIRSYKYSHSKNNSYKVSLYGHKNLFKWINEIGFSNKYKFKRAIEYKKWDGRNLNP
ncbi:MAG: LAGLIDADG family homing endonuclease [Armatimonadota bacterium]